MTDHTHILIPYPSPLLNKYVCLCGQAFSTSFTDHPTEDEVRGFLAGIMIAVLIEDAGVGGKREDLASLRSEQSVKKNDER